MKAEEEAVAMAPEVKLEEGRAPAAVMAEPDETTTTTNANAKSTTMTTKKRKKPRRIFDAARGGALVLRARADGSEEYVPLSRLIEEVNERFMASDEEDGGVSVSL